MTFLEFSFPQQVVSLRDGLGQTVLQFVCTHTHLSSTLEVSPCLCAAHSLSAVSFSGSFRRHGQICKSALLLLSTSDRIILKHCAACPPCSSASPATAHQADRGTVRLTPAAFPSFSPVSQPTKQSVTQAESALCTLHKTSREVDGNDER